MRHDADAIVTRTCLYVAGALVLILWLTGCGGGQATAEEIAQHDADMHRDRCRAFRPGELTIRIAVDALELRRR